jgi:hypothetical protein
MAGLNTIDRMTCDFHVHTVEPLAAADGRFVRFPAPATQLGALLDHFPVRVTPMLAHVIVNERGLAGGAVMALATILGRDRVVATWPWEAAHMQGQRCNGLTAWERLLLAQLEWTATRRGSDILFLAPLRLFSGQIATVLETGGRIVRDAAVPGLWLPGAWVGAEMPVTSAITLLRARQEASQLFTRLGLNGGMRRAAQ